MARGRPRKTEAVKLILKNGDLLQVQVTVNNGVVDGVGYVFKHPKTNEWMVGISVRTGGVMNVNLTQVSVIKTITL